MLISTPIITKPLYLILLQVKKLRDGLEMKHIASYYIKTIFLWEIYERNDKKYWQNKLTTLFRDMVTALYKAIEKKKISYFWHEEHNLIDGLKPTIQKIYSDKLSDVLKKLDTNDYIPRCHETFVEQK